MTTAQQYLAVQRSQLGVGETPDGSNHTPYGPAEPWCGLFQLWCAHRAGLTLPAGVDPHLVYTPSGAAAYKADGRWGRVPMVGAHVFYSWDGARIEHVECVESVLSDGTFYAIGGNVSNKVMRVHRSMSQVVGFGYPVYAAAPVHAPAPKPPVAAPTVSLRNVLYAAHHDAPAAGTPKSHPVDTLLVERALVAEGLLDRKYVDGSFGTMTIQAYSAWQRRCGFSGSGADGYPGPASLSKLGRAHGFRVTA